MPMFGHERAFKLRQYVLPLACRPRPSSRNSCTGPPQDGLLTPSARTSSSETSSSPSQTTPSSPRRRCALLGPLRRASSRRRCVKHAPRRRTRYLTSLTVRALGEDAPTCVHAPILHPARRGLRQERAGNRPPMVEDLLWCMVARYVLVAWSQHIWLTSLQPASAHVGLESILPPLRAMEFRHHFNGIDFGALDRWA